VGKSFGGAIHIQLQIWWGHSYVHICNDTGAIHKSIGYFGQVCGNLRGKSFGGAIHISIYICNDTGAIHKSVFVVILGPFICPDKLCSFGAIHIWWGHCFIDGAIDTSLRIILVCVTSHVPIVHIDTCIIHF